MQDGWHVYTIRCEGKTCTLTINGVQLATYTEADEKIPMRGIMELPRHVAP